MKHIWAAISMAFLSLLIVSTSDGGEMPPPQAVQRKTMFSPDEDTQLRALVSQYGDNRWETVAQNMPGRNIRQCRERWKHYLSASNSEPWTPIEDQTLITAYREIGPRWTKITSYLSGRTDLQVKNRLQVILRTQSLEVQTLRLQAQNLRLQAQALEAQAQAQARLPAPRPLEVPVSPAEPEGSEVPAPRFYTFILALPPL